MQLSANYVIGANRNLDRLDDKTEKQAWETLDFEIKGLDDASSTSGHKHTGKTNKIRTRAQKHWRRFWCCYLVGAVLFLAIFLPVFFLVAIPAIAQKLVNDTNLPVHSAQILDPKSDRVTFTLHTSLKTPIGLQVRIEPFDIGLFESHSQSLQPFLVVALPEYKIKGETDILVTRNATKILNESEFTKTLKTAVQQKRFVLSAKGSTIGHLGALKTPLTLEKDVELNGLDNLRGFSIDTAQLVIPRMEDGTNLVGTATLPNLSVFTFALGNVTLNLESAGLRIGMATIHDVVLKPGNNSVSLRGQLDMDTILENISDIILSQRSALRSGDIEISASGNSTVYNGVHIKYYEDVLNDLTLTARVPLVQVLAGTFQGLLESESNLGNTLRKITNGMGDFSPDVTAVAQAVHTLL